MRYLPKALMPFVLCLPMSLVADEQSFASEKERVSYSIGVQVAQNFQAQDIEIDTKTFAEGVADALSNQKALKLSEESMKKILGDFQEQQMAKMHAKTQLLAESNLEASAKFLSENKAKPGIKTTSTGLQYKVVSEGKGAPPGLMDQVVVNYRGTLLDGTEFDSSYRRNQSTTFQVSNLIPAWVEALQLMAPGAKWVLYVPPELAYGEQGAGNVIQPNSLLIFDLELIEIKPKATS